MSSHNPVNPYDAGGANEPEYLGAASPDPASGSDNGAGGSSGSGTGGGSGRHRGPLLGIAAVGLVGVLAAGGWAAMSLMGGGAQPAQAIPADAVGYLSVDLDPSAGQKIEALRMLKKFPAIDKELGLDAQDDLRRLIFDETDLADCAGIDYTRDVEPWIGERVALAAVPGEKAGAEPVPVLALQVSDEEAATKALDKVAGCDGAEGEFGYAFNEGYVLVSDSSAHAKKLAADAQEGPLSEDATFQKWTSSVGDPGIVSMYVAPGATEILADLAEAEGGLGQEGRSAQAERLAKDFEGMAGVVRFEDGAVEAEFAGQGLPQGIKQESKALSGAGDLPAGTGAAFSLGLPEGWVDEMRKAMDESSGGDVPFDEMLADAEAATGLDLPEDLERLLGDGVSIAVDAEGNLSETLEAEDPSLLRMGVRVQGDPDEVLAVVEKLKAAIGPQAEMLVTARGDGAVALGFNQEYVDTLAQDGKLGESKAFRDVVREPEKAGGVVYIDFDAGGGWLEKAADELSSMGDGSPDASVRENLAPLRAIGISGWVDGDIQRGLLRLTTE